MTLPPVLSVDRHGPNLAWRMLVLLPAMQTNLQFLEVDRYQVLLLYSLLVYNLHRSLSSCPFCELGLWELPSQQTALGIIMMPSFSKCSSSASTFSRKGLERKNFGYIWPFACILAFMPCTACALFIPKNCFILFQEYLQRSKNTIISGIQFIPVQLDFHQPVSAH